MNTATHRGAAECGRRHDTGHLQVSSNLRFGWLSDANTGLFVVYNDTQGIGDCSSRWAPVVV